MTRALLPPIAVRTVVLRAIVLLVVVNAVAGIVAIVARSGTQVGDTEGDVWLTTVVLSGAALLFLPCLLAFEAGRMPLLRVLAVVAVVVTWIGFALLLLQFWEDPVSEVIDEATLSFLTAGVALTHICLLSLVHLRAPYGWLQIAAAAFTTLLAAALISFAWTDYFVEEPSEVQVRLLALTAILAAATSILVLVFDRMARARPRAAVSRAAYCPSCGSALPSEAGRCSVCGARFRVEFLLD